MNLLLHIVHVLFFTFFNGYGYILFAANIDDFKIIAKKYMPDIFAEKLARIASDSSLFRNDDGNRPRNNTVNKMPREIARSRPEAQQQKEKEEKITEATQTASPTTLNNDKKKIPLSGIDIDELVEKIKERLDKQYLEKYKNYIVSITSSAPQTQTVEYSKLAQHEDATLTGKDQDSLRKPKQAEYDDKEQTHERHPVIQPLIKNTQEQEAPQEVGRPEFEEKDLTNTNDSYEDYKVPAKYESREIPTTGRSIKKVSSSKSPYKLNIVKKPKIYEYEDMRYEDEEKDDQQNDYDKLKSSEIKAVTENLNYDYSYKATDGNSYKATDDSQNQNYKAPQGNAKYKVAEGSPNLQKASISPQKGFRNKELSRMVKGTGIPTRERFSMSSPNYHASVPIVAEKYDFNEPLPEKDREPEDLKYFSNQPARINKKISL